VGLGANAWDRARTLLAAAGVGTNASGQTHGNGRKWVRLGADEWDQARTLGADG
jgi:hypothetical protein